MIAKNINFFYEIIFVLLILLNGVSAGGIEIREIGTKASSMGGAFRALADDGTAVFWNPAGLFQNKAPSLLAETSFIQMKARVGQNFYNAGIIPGYKTEDVEQEKRQALVPSIAYVQGLKHNLKLGFGIYIQHRFGTEFDVFYDPLNYPSYPADDMKSAGNFISIHPALAKELNDRISLGFGFFATRGNMEQRNIFILPVSSLDPSSG